MSNAAEITRDYFRFLIKLIKLINIQEINVGNFFKSVHEIL